MTFFRTNSGLKNLYKFKRSDLVVFTEGGGQHSITRKQLIEGEYYSHSDDIYFWRKLFDRYCKKTKVSFRAVGSKNTLKELAQEVKGIASICVAMDRDFDDIFDDVIIAPNVIYTRCYSWESELFATQVCVGAFSNISTRPFSEPSVKKTVRQIINDVMKDLRHYVRADLIFCSAGRPLFVRKSPQAGLCVSKEAPPTINHNYFKNRIVQQRCEVRGYFLLRRFSVLSVSKNCFGKFLGNTAVQVVIFLLNKHSCPALNKEYCMKFLVDAFAMWLDGAPRGPVAKYYQSRISAL